MAGLLDRLSASLRRLRGGTLPVFYHPAYRLPLPGLEATLEPRRADLVAWFLVEQGLLPERALRQPERLPLEHLSRVHSRAYLASLAEPATLAAIFAADPAELRVDEVLHSLRLACFATLAGARLALDEGRPVINLLGGFHHAAPDRGSGLCAINDLAIAVAALRAEGFGGRVVILDLDAHPPDGTARCFAEVAGLEPAWIGSLSGSDWGPLPGVDETLLPPGCADEPYLAALDGLLARRPAAALAFVLAGGDVLAGDRLGRLGLTLEGARTRDQRILDALGETPQVWLPGGGYHRDSWRLLAHTALTLAGSTITTPQDYDPLRVHFAAIAAKVSRESLTGGLDLNEDDVADLFGRAAPHRLLGFYTAAGIEHALWEYGILGYLERLGYQGFHITLDRPSVGERVRLLGAAAGIEHTLAEMVLQRRRVGTDEVLFVHWLTLRHPKAHFNDLRPCLPGQEVPGLGLAREFDVLLGQIARRLELAAVAFRPAWYHMAYAARHHFRFVDDGRQARFLALIRDLAGRPLLAATHLLADGRVRLAGAPYSWEPDEMVYWLEEARAAAPVAADPTLRFTVDDDDAP